eukprot:TRINITY_DN976_c2_g1_i3.p1 TRINITY_DN976_c2_g1~~TRINITY_DN976_c2_g1_i3.p1  ORF type:complete len:126 (-),score=14.29 TRINITY_DN976_c2_g1_i3:83-460(-)
MSKVSVHTDKAPKAVGPYSQAIKANGFIFLSGSIGLEPSTGVLVEGLEAQTHQAFANIKAVLQESGSDLDKVVKVTVFMKNMSDYAAVNAIYATYFKEPYPARSAVEVAALPKAALVEIEVVALQ